MPLPSRGPRSKSAKKCAEDGNWESLHRSLRLKDEEILRLKADCQSLEEKLQDSSTKYEEITIFQKILEEKMQSLAQTRIDPALSKKESGFSESGVLSLVKSIEEELHVARKKNETEVSRKIEELERRVTELHGMYSQLKMEFMSVESGLHKALEMRSLPDVKDHILTNCIPKSSQALSFSLPKYTFTPSVENSSDLSSPSSDQEEPTVEHIVKRFRPKRQDFDEEYPRTLVKPPEKFPGDTHIRKMDTFLRKYLTEELSREHESRCDWREMALRVGLTASTVDSWEELHLPCPMSQVLAFWGDCPEATVRMLHRHLRSPSMQATLLAKYVADFYNVD